jgi:hypothetical protein
MRSFLLVLTAIVATAPPARAQEVVTVREHCLRVAASGSGDPWIQWLRLGDCVQDMPVFRVEHEDQLEPMLAALKAGVAPALRLYLYAAENAPAEIQVRAAYHIAATQLGLIIRARASIVAPPDLMTSAASATRYRELHERLEVRLVEIRHIAVLAFGIVVLAADENPELEVDPTMRYLVRHAREVLPLLAQPVDRVIRVERARAAR